MMYMLFFFFFQAEDGIRDVAVTGVQTCALPISFENLLYLALPLALILVYMVMAAQFKSLVDPFIIMFSIPMGFPGVFVMLFVIDRKSTRLNSSHGYISYAVFCLKKKTKRHSFTP